MCDPCPPHRRPEARIPSWEIRSLAPSEAVAVGELTAQAYLDEGFASPAYAEVLRDTVHRRAHSEVLVAVDDSGTPRGTVTFAVAGGPYADVARPGEAEFRMLAVDSAARGRGVGVALVDACVELARAAGCWRLVLSTGPRMVAAHRLYERRGFVRIPARDWSPAAGVELRVYALELGGS